VRLVAAFVRRDLADDLAHRLTFVIELIDGLVLLAAVFLLSRGLTGLHASGYPPFTFLFVGLAVNTALMVCLGCFAVSIRGARAAGILKAMLVMPVPLEKQVMASAVYPILRGLFDAGLHLTAALGLGLTLASANVAGAVLVLALGLGAASALGILSAAFAIVFRRGDPLLWLIGVIGLVFGGVFYPVDQLPTLAAAAGWVTPVAPTLAAMRPLLLDGASLADVSTSVAALAVYAGAGLPLSLTIFNLAVRRARQQGTIRDT